MGSALLTTTALLIVNPSSGRGRSRRLWPGVRDALQANGFDVAVHITTSLPDATAAAAGAGSGTLVASLGGDGLHGAVAAGVRGTGSVLLLLGGGRGNDTVRRLGLPVHPVRSARRVLELAVRPLDLGSANGVPFLGVAHAGFDSLAAEFANQVRLPLGPLSYILGGVKALCAWRGAEFRVTVEGTQHVFPGWFVAAGNVGQYGRGLCIAPHAVADDGRLDVVVMGAGSRLRVVSVFLRAFRGAHLAQPGIRCFTGQTLRIDAAPGISLYADGELVGPLPVDVTVLPAAILALVPRTSPVLRELPGDVSAHL